MSNPVKTFRNGGCQASVFVNERRDGDRTFQVYSVSFQRRYRSKDGQWESTNTYGVNDLPRAMRVLEKAYDYVTASQHEEE